MVNFSDIVGTLMQSGMSRSSTKRLGQAIGGRSGISDSLTSFFGKGSGVGDALTGLLGGGGGLSAMLKGALGDANQSLGGGNKLALGGLGALAGALFSGKGAVKGALGGGAMAILGAMAYSAIKGSGEAKAEVPVGLRQPETAGQREELEQGAQLVLKAMINAAKADGQIDRQEIQRILGKLEEAGADQEARDYVLEEMNGPVDLEGITAAAQGRPQLAAQVYAASLLAIEVDTPAETQYMQKLADELGISSDVAARLERAVGLHK
jgi:uncharacterized membrane protein YebE (DUF533 family)